jgi:hypothetical protein
VFLLSNFGQAGRLCVGEAHTRGVASAAAAWLVQCIVHIAFVAQTVILVQADC